MCDFVHLSFLRNLKNLKSPKKGTKKFKISDKNYQNFPKNV